MLAAGKLPLPPGWKFGLLLWAAARWCLYQAENLACCNGLWPPVQQLTAVPCCCCFASARWCLYQASWCALLLHYCRRAHNTLFISELASQRERLPEALRSPGSAGGKKRKAKREDSDSDFDAPAPGGEGDGQQVQDAVNLKGIGRGMVDKGLKARAVDEGAA